MFVHLNETVFVEVEPLDTFQPPCRGSLCAPHHLVTLDDVAAVDGKTLPQTRGRREGGRRKKGRREEGGGRMEDGRRRKEGRRKEEGGRMR